MTGTKQARRPGVRDVLGTVRLDRWGAPVAQEREEAGSWLVWSFVVGAPLSLSPAWRGAGSVRVAVLRWAGLGAVLAVVYGYTLAPPADGWWWVWAGWAAAGVVLGVQGWRLVGWLLSWRHRRRWVRPLDVALRSQLGYPRNFPARRWLSVPSDLAEDEDGIRVQVPANFVGKPKQRELIERTVVSKLALGDIEEPSWRLASRNHFVQFKAKARPPAAAAFRDPAVREMVERAKRSKPLMGLAAGGKAVAVDLDSESPHMVVSAGTGAGKSNMLRGVAAQLMHHGASLLILDYKRRSHRWAKGLEGVTYCRDIAEIHRALIGAADEAMQRNVLADQYPDDQEPPWQRRVILLEELNSTMEELTAYWREELAGRGTSPAVRAYRQILFMGRQVKEHILTASQLFTAQSAGGPAARAQYGTIVMSRFKAAAWKMLLPEITPTPKSGRHPGRGWVALGGDADETQLVYWTEAETRAWASSGRSSAVRGTAVSADPHERETQGEEPADAAGRPVLTVVRDESDARPSDEGLVTLWQASIDKGEALVGLTYNQLRDASRRDGEFPEPVDKTGRAYLYQLNALERWSSNRERPGKRTS